MVHGLDRQKKKKKHKADCVFCFVLLFFFQRTEEANPRTRRGGPQGFEDDDQAESELVCTGGLADDAVQGGLTPPQQQGARANTGSSDALKCAICRLVMTN